MGIIGGDEGGVADVNAGANVSQEHKGVGWRLAFHSIIMLLLAIVFLLDGSSGVGTMHSYKFHV